jgi:hypothetical protein
MSRHWGRWTYNSDSIQYGEAGWHLNGTPLVLDFMPGRSGECPHTGRCRGSYLLYGDPCWHLHTASVGCFLRDAMRWTEEHWDHGHAQAVAS